MLLTIVIPTYNQANFLDEALTGLCLQTNKEFRLIVSDNCSGDRTEDVVNSYSMENMKYIKETNFLDKTSNWNRACSYSDTKYTLLHHSDDSLYPDAVKRLLDYIKNDSNVGLFHGAYDVIDNQGNTKRLVNFPFSYKYDNQNCLLNIGCSVGIVGVTFKTELFHRVKGFNKNFLQIQDWEFYHKLIQHAPFKYVNRKLGRWREGVISPKLSHVQRIETLELIERINDLIDCNLLMKSRLRQLFASNNVFYKKHPDFFPEYIEYIENSSYKNMPSYSFYKYSWIDDQILKLIPMYRKIIYKLKS